MTVGTLTPRRVKLKPEGPTMSSGGVAPVGGGTWSYIGVAVQRDDSDLAGRIDRVLDELRSDGTLVRLGREWLGTDAPNTTTSVLS